MDEQPFFLRNRCNKRLFAVLHRPAHSALSEKVGVLVCHALLEERLNSHRVLVNFARYAAKQGYYVLRFDYFGDGESEGLFHEASVSSRLSDISAAVEYFRERVGVSAVFLLGLRFGGTLCIKYSCESKGHNGVIAWAPILKGKPYLLDILRINLGTQVMLYGKVKRDRSRLVQAIKMGEMINIDGYRLGSPFFDEAEGIDFTAADVNVGSPMLAVDMVGTARSFNELQKFRKGKSTVEAVIIKERKIWTPLKKLYPSCDKLFTATCAWISRHV